MEPEKPRIARLTSILTQLQTKKLVTARELADRNEVSIRTIYRDINTLANSGIPIYTEEGKGYCLMESYRLSPVAFTEDEANAIITAQHILKHINDQSFKTSFESAVTKIKSVLKNSQKEKAQLLNDRIQIRNLNSSNLNNSAPTNNISLVQKAITDYTLLKIEYNSLEDESSKRIIEPFALYSTQGNWILVAFCRERGDWRSFRLDRIQKASSTAEIFSPHRFTLQEYFEICRKKVFLPLTYL